MATNGDEEFPSIAAEKEKWETKFYEACEDLRGGGECWMLLKDLSREYSSPHYRFKAELVLSGIDICTWEDENIPGMEFHSEYAEAALKDAEETYVHNSEDAVLLAEERKALEKEWEELHLRQEIFEEDGEDEELLLIEQQARHCWRGLSLEE